MGQQDVAAVAQGCRWRIFASKLEYPTVLESVTIWKGLSLLNIFTYK